MVHTLRKTVALLFCSLSTSALALSVDNIPDSLDANHYDIYDQGDYDGNNETDVILKFKPEYGKHLTITNGPGITVPVFCTNCYDIVLLVHKDGSGNDALTYQFVQPVDVSTGGWVSSSDVKLHNGDFDGDGKTEMLFEITIASFLDPFLIRSDGGSETDTNYYPFMIADMESLISSVSDVNSDGYDDVTFADGTIRFGNSSGTLPVPLMDEILDYEFDSDYSERMRHLIARTTWGGDPIKMLGYAVDEVDNPPTGGELDGTHFLDSQLEKSSTPNEAWFGSSWVAHEYWLDNSSPYDANSINGQLEAGGETTDFYTSPDAVFADSYDHFNHNAQYYHLTEFQVVYMLTAHRQLNELMTWFWENHFNTYYKPGAGNPTGLPNQKQRVENEYIENNNLRKYAMTTFEDVLRVSMTSPSMMFYLHNYLNTTVATSGGVTKPNEDYGRELLELHTLTPESGYTDVDGGDIEIVSRVLAGWGIGNDDTNDSYDLTYKDFEFFTTKHSTIPDFDDSDDIFDNDDETDDGHPVSIFYNFENNYTAYSYDSSKSELTGCFDFGNDVKCKRGEALLQFLAKHEYTARNVCSKLTKYFVTDQIYDLDGNDNIQDEQDSSNRFYGDGVPDLIDITDACIDSFMATRNHTDTADKDVGDIKDMLEVMFIHTDFDSYANQKIKNPIKMATSIVRNLVGFGAEYDVVYADVEDMGLKLFDNKVPTGWAENGTRWINVNMMMERMITANDSALTNSLAEFPLGEFVWAVGLVNHNYIAKDDDIVDLFMELLMLEDLPSAQHTAVRNAALDLIDDELDMSATMSIYQVYQPDTDAEDQIQAMVAFLLSQPAYQYN